MKSFSLILLVLASSALLSVHVRAEAEVDEKDVLVLTTANFDEEVGKQDFSLIEFYAPWCGHCKKLKPEYAGAATKLVEDGVTNVRLAKVDCTSEKEVCDKYEVRGYPTIKWFRKGGEPIDFEGQRTADGIVEYAKRFSGPVLTDLANKEDVEKFSKSGSVIVIAYVDSDDSRKIVEEAAESLRADASFGVAAPDLAPSGKSGVYAYLKFADEPVAFDGEIKKADEIVQFVTRESFPIVDEISPENYKRYIERGLPLVWVFIEKDGRDANIDILKSAASDSKGKLSWVYLDAQDYGRHAENMGLSDKYPGLVVDDSTAKKKFLYPEDGKFEADALRTWADKVIKGEVDAFVKSEPIPEDNSGPLTKVVGKNYEDVVMDKSKDVLLEFYAPWCGHCKQLEPKYKALAEMFKDDSTIVIAQVDGTENDIPLDVKGFPTIFFFPADGKDKPLTYDGDRSAGALAAYVAKESSTLSEERKKEITSAKVPEEADEAEEDDDDGEYEEKDL